MAGPGPSQAEHLSEADLFLFKQKVKPALIDAILRHSPALH